MRWVNITTIVLYPANLSVERLWDLYTLQTFQLKFLESTKKAEQEYCVQYHKLQLSNTELSMSLEHREAEVKKICGQLEENEKVRQVLVAKCNALRKEKEELEELVADNQGTNFLYVKIL